MPPKNPEDQPKPLSKEQVIKKGHRIIGKEGHVQGPLPGFNPEPFDPHEQFVFEEARYLQEQVTRGRMTPEEAARKTAEATLESEEERYTDPLTGLKNRRFFQEYMATILPLASRTNSEIALLLIDLDHFKRVNDSYGHPKGDELLKKVADAMKKSIRKSDLTFRLGGEEFGIVLMNQSPIRNPQELIDKIRLAIETSTKELKWLEWSQTASIGFVRTSDLKDLNDPRAISELLDKADQALYVAKNNGRNKSVIYNSSLEGTNSGK